MIQVGHDKEVSTADSRKIVGIAFDYTHADTDLTGISGSGSNDRYALNLLFCSGRLRRLCRLHRENRSSRQRL
ncbi:MAG: autotransporter domain-containing protein [Sutterella wadsworthensis]